MPVQERHQIIINSTKNYSLSISLSIFWQTTSLIAGLRIYNKRIAAPSRTLEGDVIWWELSTVGFASTALDKSMSAPSRLTGVLSPKMCLCCRSPASLRTQLRSPLVHTLLSPECGFWLPLSAGLLPLWRTKDDLHFLISFTSFKSSHCMHTYFLL